MDFAIWAMLEVPRNEVRNVLLAEGQGDFDHEEGSGRPPDLAHMYRWGYWGFGPEWLPPLPERFERYLAVYRGEARDGLWNVREAIAELGDGDGDMVMVYVFYTTY